jgi:hypothetical protein
MNTTEKKYLMTRIEELKNQKLAEYRNDKRNDSKSFDMKYKLVKEGRVKLHKNVNKSNAYAFSEFDFDKFPATKETSSWELLRSRISSVISLSQL